MIKLPKPAILVAAFFFVTVSAALVTYLITSRSEETTRENRFDIGYSDGTYLYNCSKEIELRDTGMRNGVFEGEGPRYEPVNPSEANKYCRSSGVIEYRAVIDILKRDDVSSTIAKYDTTKAWVKALGHVYIHDKDYLKRILPAYSDIQIDCIIVVHSPEGTRFFIEDGTKHESHDDHHYREIPTQEFLTSLNNASDTDITNFWLGLH